MAAVTKIQRYLLESDVLSVADTTDVSVFADAARANEVVPLPTSCLFKFVALHAVFNQQELWEAFIDEGIVSYSDRSIKEAGIPSLLRRFKRNGKKTRSSNYRAIQLQQISAENGGETGMRRAGRRRPNEHSAPVGCQWASHTFPWQDQASGPRKKIK